MKTKIDNCKIEQDETKFPHLRIDDDLEGYIYIFYSNLSSLCLSHSDVAVRSASFAATEYYTGSITLSND